MSRLVRFARPAVVVTAVVLVAAATQARPAAAAPPEPLRAALSITSHAVYAPDQHFGASGDSINAPADAGPAPGSLRVSVEISNVGTDALRNIDVVTPDVSNGHRDTFRCDDVASQPPWGDPDLTLYPGDRVYCTATISGIATGSRHVNATTVTAVGKYTRTPVSGTTHVWALAGPLDQPLPPPPTVSVGHRVWLDTNRNRAYDAGEPGIPGAHLTIQLLCCQPVPDSAPLFAETTTDEHGIYHFRDLQPGLYYTVTLDMDPTSVFAGLAPWGYPLGTEGQETSSLHVMTSGLIDTYDAVDFGFIPKDHLTISVKAPTTAYAGTKIDVAARTYATENPDRSWGVPTVLEFRRSETTTWSKVADVPSAYESTAHARVTASRSGWFRLRSTGNLYVTSGVSREVHVLVRTVPVALTAAAPATVRRDAPLTVTGTITRQGTPFTTGRIVLERMTDAENWKTVATVRSSAGSLSATVKPARTGSYRFHYAGDSTTDSGTSPVRQVVAGP